MISPGHVGIVTGTNEMIDAPQTGMGVSEQLISGVPDLVGIGQAAQRLPVRPAGTTAFQVADRPYAQPGPLRQLLLGQPGRLSTGTQPRPNTRPSSPIPGPRAVVAASQTPCRLTPEPPGHNRSDFL